ncbi:nitrilase-related carbon-nitrogen hydrolase [Thermoflavifilum thermophilum]|uniref:Omega-amidase YafV n=1 Tax=Thermoflavifilum thermophilum TaxID=1393122 RepID=A0A1I7N978_9BACT|nr:nitrilase-related carbon-nitrogen hydrolase [Thermoflavifilum thermophilum]SFV31254.1 Carbon-nitrogen hydrolase [Thermoflavifilum thermophilum]
MKSHLHIALMQIDIQWEQIDENLQQIAQQLATLPGETEVVFLPEMFATGFSMHAEKLAQPMNGKIVQWMRELAYQHRIILCGSVIIYDEGNYWNRLIWMQPDGNFGTYDKRHLFAYAEENKYYTPGYRQLIVQVNGWRIALCICYDLRFPVWCAQQPTDDGSAAYDVLAVIASWPASRIEAWDLLLRARALENQAYVIGVNRVGEEPPATPHASHGTQYPGHSAIVDPVGKWLYHSTHPQPEIITHTLSAQHLQQVRKHFPFLRDRDRFTILNHE